MAFLRDWNPRPIIWRTRPRGRRAVRHNRPRHGSALGAQGLGRLVGLGRARDDDLRHVDGVHRVLLLRRFGGPGSETLSAAVGVCGMALVPFVYHSVDWWRTIHPQTTVIPKLPPEMRYPFFWCALAFEVLYVPLLLIRTKLEASKAAVEQAYLELED
jgi:ABC-type transport system involved in cytochrome c biogenesis permease subunit